MKNQDSSESNIYTYHILVMTLSASIFGIAGVTEHYAIAFIGIVPYIISAFAINRRRKVEQNCTPPPNTPTHKENVVMSNNAVSLQNKCKVIKFKK